CALESAGTADTTARNAAHPQRQRPALRSRYARSRARRRAAEAQPDDAPPADRPAAEFPSRGHAPGTRARALGRFAAAGRFPACPHARAAYGDRQELSREAPAHHPWHRLSTFGRTGTFVG